MRAALSFALVVLSTCGLFLLLAAPFLMAATIIIYAGAIIVTFLFVIMLAQQAGLSDADQRSREPFLACVAGFVLLGAMLLRAANDLHALTSWTRCLRATEQASQQSSAEGMPEGPGRQERVLRAFSSVQRTERPVASESLAGQLPRPRWTMLESELEADTARMSRR